MKTKKSKWAIVLSVVICAVGISFFLLAYPKMLTGEIVPVGSNQSITQTEAEQPQKPAPESTLDAIVDDLVTDGHLAEKLYIPLSAAVIALLGVAITIYIFMCEGLRELKHQKPYVEKTVDKLKEHYGRILFATIFVSLFSLAVGVFLSNWTTDFLYSYAYRIYVIFSFLSIGILMWFNMSLIDYDDKIRMFAIDSCKKCANEFNEADCANDSESIMRYIKICSDMKMIVDIIINQNTKLVGQIPEKERFSVILDYIIIDKNKKQDIINDYEALFNILNYAIVAQEYSTNTSLENELWVPLEKAVRLEQRIMQCCMAGGVFRDIALVSKMCESADFSNTSFEESFINDLTLKKSKLDGTSFRSCRLQAITFSGKENQIKNVDFSNTVILDFKHDERIPFINCDFANADFSEQKELKNLSFEASNLYRTNFNGCLLTDVDMCGINGTDVKFNSAELHDVPFRYSNLTGAVFSSSTIGPDEPIEKGDAPVDMSFVDLSSGNFFYATLNHVNMENARLPRANIVESFLKDCKISDAYCNDASFARSQLKDVNLSHSLLNRADFSHTLLKGTTSLENCLCVEALFIKTRAVEDNESGEPQNARVSFRSAQFINAQFINSKFQDCDFSGAVFDDAVISADTRFIRCNFENSRLKNALILGDIKEIFENCNNLPFECAEGADFSNYGLKAIIGRKSTRFFANAQNIDEDTIRKLFEAARWAPSAKNRQPWIYYVCSEDMKHNICALLQKADRQGSATAIHTASKFLLVFRNTHGVARDVSDETALPDLLSIGASVQNILVAAEMLRLSSLWICDVLDVAEDLSALIKADPTTEHLDSNTLVSGICLGYSADLQEQTNDTLEKYVKHRNASSPSPRKSIGSFVIRGDVIHGSC